MDYGSSDNPLTPLVNLWLSLMKKARDHKWKAFGQTAEECWKFFDGAHDFMYDKTSESIGMSADNAPKTTFRMTLNKVAELVQLFGPSLYYKNPHRQANPKKPDVPMLAIESLVQKQAQQQIQMAAQSGQLMPMDPAMAQQAQAQFAQQMMMGVQQGLQDTAATNEATASLLAWVLNFTPNEFDLRGECRMAIDEALIKGRGVLLHEMYQQPGSTGWLPRTTWVSVDDLLIDPDAKTLKAATWIALRVQEPRWQVERERGLRPGSLKHCANFESTTRSAEIDNSKNGVTYRRRGDSHDLVTYYKIWSKAGAGQHLALGGSRESDLDGLQETLEAFGDYVYLEVCEGCSYPLNLPDDVLDAEATEEAMADLSQRLSWPVPFYKDNEWPISVLDFHPLPGCPWPQAHMKPALGELRFLNWAMSFLAGRIRTTSRVFIALAEHLDEEIKQEIENGGDLTILPLKMNINKQIHEVVQFLQHPEVNSDIWKIIAAVMELFDKRVGLTELVYGISGKQMRSASEAQVKEERTSVRPDDMAEQVESWQTAAARKEAIMLRLYSGPDAVAPLFGEAAPTVDPMNPQPTQPGIYSQLWQQYVYLPPEAGEEAVNRAFREFEYRIEAGSIRKPNMDRDQTNMDQAMQVLLQPLMQAYYSSGNPQQLNAFISDWAKTRQLDATPYLFQPFQPAPPAPPAGSQPVQEAA